MGDWWSYLSIFDPTDPENFEVGLIILATIWFIVSWVNPFLLSRLLSVGARCTSLRGHAWNTVLEKAHCS